MNMVGERGRRHDPTAGQTDASFEAYTKGVGSRILKQQGWRRGQPIGRRAGLLEPLEAEGNDPGDRRGIGYRGPRDDSAGRDDRERWRATSTVWYDETGRRHVRLSAEEAAAQAAAAPPKKKAHIIGTAFD